MTTPLLFVAMFLFVSYLNGNVQAYLDLGTGSVALQLIAGGIVAALATTKLYWHRLKSFLSPRSTPEPLPSEKP